MYKSHYLIFFLLAVSLSACMQRQAIKYPVDDISKASNSMFENAVLAVKPFEDARKPLASCSGDKVTKIERGDKTFYYNCDKHYETDSVTREITRASVDHLDRAHLFKKVILTDDASPNADYLLTGKVSRFDGLKEYKAGAVVASKFGPIGSMINRIIDSSFEGTTDLDNLKLIRLKDKAVVWSGKVSGHIEGSDEVDPDGWSCYTIANLSLKNANNNLLKALAKLKAGQNQNYLLTNDKSSFLEQ